MNLSLITKIRKVENYTSANTTEITSDAVDMSGFTGVVFLTTIAVANAGNYIKAQQSDDEAFTDPEDLTGTKVIATAANQLVGADIYRPLKRYVRLHVTRTASTAVGEIYAQQYDGKVKPCDNEVTDTVLIESHISPIEGTA